MRTVLICCCSCGHPKFLIAGDHPGSEFHLICASCSQRETTIGVRLVNPDRHKTMAEGGDVPNVVVPEAPSAIKPKREPFDRKAYQREYMRRYMRKRRKKTKGG